MTIRLAHVNRDHFSEIVELHMDALSIGIMPQVGKSLVIRYYKKIFEMQDTDQAYGHGAFCENQLIGFIFNLKKPVLLYSCLGLKEILKILWVIVSKPGYLVVLLLGLYVSAKWRSTLHSNLFEISSIAVSEKFRGLGVGKSLVRISNQWAKSSGADGIYTFTHNKELADFYCLNYDATVMGEVNLIKYRSQIVIWRV